MALHIRKVSSNCSECWKLRSILNLNRFYLLTSWSKQQNDNIFGISINQKVDENILFECILGTVHPTELYLASYTDVTVSLGVEHEIICTWNWRILKFKNATPSIEFSTVITKVLERYTTMSADKRTVHIIIEFIDSWKLIRL